MRLVDESGFKADAPCKFQILHTLAAASDSRTGKAVYIVFAFGMPSHCSEQLCFGRRLDLVFGRKPAAIKQHKVFGI